MKDLFKEIKDQSKNKFNTEFKISKDQVDTKGNLKLIILLAEIEESLKVPLNVLQNVAPFYEKVLKNIDFQRIENALVDELIEFECRFYRINKRSVEIRVFVRTKQKNNKIKKVAKVSYIYQAVFSGKTAA